LPTARSNTSLAHVDIGSVAFLAIAAHSFGDKRISNVSLRRSFSGFGGRPPGCFFRAMWIAYSDCEFPSYKNLRDNG
jgi:hypothetical protein